MKFDKKRMQQLLETVDDEAKLATFLIRGFNIHVGLMWQFEDEQEPSGMTGCIAGVAWLLAGGKIPDEADDYCLKYWDCVLPGAVAWLRGYGPIDMNGRLKKRWKKPKQPPLFSSTAASEFRKVRRWETGDESKVGPKEAAEAIRRVMQHGDLYFDPWKEMASELVKTAEEPA